MNGSMPNRNQQSVHQSPANPNININNYDVVPFDERNESYDNLPTSGMQGSTYVSNPYYSNMYPGQQNVNNMAFNYTGSPAMIPDSAVKPEALTNPVYIPAYLAQNIGQWLRVEFMLGNSLIHRTGQLIEVGASFIVLKTINPSTTIVCDIYSIRFITIAYDKNLANLLP